MTIERPMFPPRAESVDSFSLQPAIGQPKRESHVNESRKPAEGLSRRVVLAGVASAAAMPIAGALPSTAEAAADPIFAVIEAHRVAHDAHWAAIHASGNLMDWGAITEKPCHADYDAFELLIGAPADTLPGLQAKLAYLRAIAEGEEAWMLDEREGAALNLIDSLTASLKNIGVWS